MTLTLSDDCAVSDGRAAGYGGWDGTIHRFYFANPAFACAFRRANARKIVC